MESRHFERRPPEALILAVEAAADPSETTASALDRFEMLIVRRLDGASLALRIAAEEPGSIRAQLRAAILHLLDDTAAGVRLAHWHLADARLLTCGAEAREISLLDAFDAKAHDRPVEAIRCFRDHLTAFPEDVFAAYIAHLHCLDHGLFQWMDALAEGIRRANPTSGAALAMASFAQDQAGAAPHAEELALAALEADPALAWGHHALAHVWLSNDRPHDAARVLRSLCGHWSACGSSMYTHNWWHLLLCHLATGDFDRTLDLYDEHLAPHGTRAVSSFVNATSLLARLELSGIEVRDRWHKLADIAEQLVPDHRLAFIDAHHALALGRAGRIQPLDALLRGGSEQESPVWRTVGAPLIEATAAYATGDHRRAGALFDRALPRSVAIGGSSAQRALFPLLARASHQAAEIAA